MRSQDERRKFNILIVDDERENLHILFHTLRTEYDVAAANSGKMALEKIEREKPDLILLDIVMPDMDGYEVLSRLKENNETREIPVIFITGLSNPEDETKALFLGAVDYISKPFNASVVRARVKTHLQIAKQMRMIERVGMIDALTEIPNRRRFDRQLEIDWAHAIREQTPISLLMIDIDDFKAYNDTHGHPAGDALLQTLAGTVTACVRRPHDLFARIGGEEFAVLLPATDMTGAAAVGESIRAAIEALNIPGGLDLRRPVTVSVGAESVVPGRGVNSADFIARCDKKLYAAKRTGKNKLICYADDLPSAAESGTTNRTQSIVPTKTLRNLLNALDTYMFVSNMETDAILFVNDKMKERFQLGDNVIGQPCNRVMNQCMEERCEFCVKQKLLERPDDDLKLETLVYLSGRHYKKIDQSIDWIDNQKVHLQYFIDVTELKQTETQLRLAYDLINSSPQYISYIDTEGNYEIMNPATYEITGYSHDELMAGGVHILYDEDTRRRIADEIIPAITERGNYEYEIPITRKNGEVRVMAFSSFSVASDSNKHGCIATDITKQKRLEQEISAAKAKLEFLINTAPVAYGLSADGVVLEANEYAKKHLGITPGKKTASFYVDYKERETLFDLRRTGNSQTGGIIRFYMPDGGIHRFFANYSILTQDGIETCVFWAVDVEREEAQRDMLWQAHENLQTALDFLPLPNFVIDGEKGTIIYIGGGAINLFKVESPEAVYGRSVGVFMPEVQPDGTNSSDKINVLNGIERADSLELVCLKANGETFNALVTACAIEYKGVRSTLCVIQDLTADRS